jgi:hypothetical protein
MNKIIIYQEWGGLGDNLQFSTLPELFSKYGYDVYISIDNKVRNEEIFDLVWGLNPYIKGISNEESNAGQCRCIYWPPIEQNENFIHRIELSHGFERTNLFPKIYYNPQIIQELNNDILIDLTGSTQVYKLHKYIEYIDYFTNLINNKNQKIKIITFEKIQPNPIFEYVYKYLKKKILNIEYLKVHSLINYCDVIKSCDTIIIVNSGINSLASAIKQNDSKPLIMCYNPWSQRNPQQIKGFYNYKNVEYFQSNIV